jgi:hypothetical protein
MPRGPKGQRRPADVIGNAVHVMQLATGEIEESCVAVALVFISMMKLPSGVSCWGQGPAPSSR